MLITVWQNALTQDPLSVDSLQQELKTLKVTKEQEKLIMGRRSKSASMNSDASIEFDASVASVTDSAASTPVHPMRHSSTDTITNPTEDSDLGDDGERMTGHHYQSYHNTHHRTSHTQNSSPSSSRSGSPSEEESGDSNSSKSGDSDDPDYEPPGEKRREEVDSSPKRNGKRSIGMPRSPSLVTLRSESPREVGVTKGVPRVGGGSPNMFHYWKQTWSFSSAWRRVTLMRPVEVVRRPMRFVSMCSTSQLINFFISIA